MKSQMEAIKKSMGWTEWLLLITLSVLWGGSFFFIAVAVKDLPPLTIVMLRVGLAALTLDLIVRWMKLRVSWDRQVWLAFFGIGLLNNLIPFSLIVWGQSHISGGLASILNATTPLFTVIVAHLSTKDERMTAGRLIGVLIGFAGVVLMIGAETLKGLGAGALAQLAVLGAAVSYALAGIYGRRFQRLGISPLVAAAGQVKASTVLIIPVVLITDRPWTLSMPGPETWGAVVGLALFSTALAYILYFRILATAGATNVLLVTFLIPLSAILLGTIVLGEVLEPKHSVGMVLIGLGLAAIDGRPLDFLRRLIRRTSYTPLFLSNTRGNATTERDER